jgi:hypothetical protein
LPLRTAADLPPGTADNRAGPRRDFTAVVRGVPKDTDPVQLKQHLGGADVCTSASEDGTLVVLADVDQKTLDAAVNAVVAAAPGIETARATAAAQRSADLETIRAKAKADPAFAALLRTVGIQ